MENRRLVRYGYFEFFAYAIGLHTGGCLQTISGEDILYFTFRVAGWQGAGVVEYLYRLKTARRRVGELDPADVEVGEILGSFRFEHLECGDRDDKILLFAVRGAEYHAELIR